MAVSQRYGCTTFTGEPDNAPSYCPLGYTKWHQGIDIQMNTGTAIYSQQDGTIVASQSGVLGFRTNAGNVVYLLHGYCVGAFCNVGQAVHIGDELITSACVPPVGGSCTGPHLHFEVHASIVGELSVPTGPGDDINPEGWLFRIPAAGGNQLISLGPANYLSEFAISSGSAASLYETDRWPSTWTSWTSDGAPISNGQPQYLLSSQDPVVVRQNPNEWDAFVLTANGDLGMWYKAPNCVGAWLLLAHPTGTALVNGLTAVTRSSGYLDAFVLSSGGGLYHAYARRGSGCSYSLNWDPTNPFAANPPGNFWDVASASANDNNIYVVAKSGSTIWMTHFDNSTWDVWSPLPALPNGYTPVSGTSAVAWTTSNITGSITQELYAFVRGQSGSDFQLFYGYYKSTGWVGWQTYTEQGTAFVPSSIFTAVSWTTFRIDLFVRDSQFRFGGWLWHNAYDPHLYNGNGNWSGWTGQNFYAPPNDELGSHLGVESFGYPNIDVTSQATPDEANYRYWHLCYCNNTWDSLPSGP